jgi:protocatechuate 3,4-dioxygenase beta subunit
MKRVALFLSVFSLLVASAAAAPRPHSGIITGTVLGPDGKAVAGARVALQSSAGRHPQTRLTDAEGHFHFRELSTGLYDMRAYANGLWSVWHHNILLRANTEIDVDLVLKPKKPAKK